jgi:hypothetical protein
MTGAAKTPSQRGRSNRNKGHQAERDLCKWLRINGFPDAERAVRTGFRVGDRTSTDPGDITGTPGIIWSIKDCAVERISEWLRELDAMAASDDDAVRLLVHKRRGHAMPHRWWCWMELGPLVSLAGRGPAIVSFPVRMELGHVVPVLRAAGYGTPLEAAS